MNLSINNSEFTCIRCGQCCRWHGYVHVSEEEVEEIALAIGMDIAEFYETMVMPGDGDGVSLNENKDGTCPFYVDLPPGCRIYECRPLQCRTYPLKWNNPDTPCPGLPRTCTG
ncbi:MAG: YkgJ family cysteine cluster protein [Victivallales bacterium]